MITLPRRTLQDVRTHAGGARAAGKPYSLFAVLLKIAMLQLERERRASDQAQAAVRMARCGERIRELDAQIQALRASASEAGAQTVELQAPTAAALQVTRAPATPSTSGASESNVTPGGPRRVFRF